MNGPIAQEALLSLALPSSSAERPSTVAQVDVVAERRADDRAREATRRARPRARGCSSCEFGCSAGIHAGARPPTSAGALVKISASGPMPTSRYWLPGALLRPARPSAPWPRGEPGFSLRGRRRRAPRWTSRAHRRGLRGIAACPLLDHALQHRTAKVTPAALIACRSIGRAATAGTDRAGPAACWREDRPGGPIASAIACAKRPRPGSGVSQRSRTVGKAPMTSRSPLVADATTEGPPRSGRQTRPTSAPAVASSGRADEAIWEWRSIRKDPVNRGK